VKGITETELAVLFDERTDSKILRSLCLSAAEKAKTAAVFGGDDDKFTFVIAGEEAQGVYAKMKASLNVRGGGKEVICGTAFEGRSKIETIFNGENI
jgi:hypothetical protein